MKRVLVAVSAAALTAALVAAVSAFGHSSVGAQTFTVNVDGKNPSANEAFIAYFPNVIRVHPGDAVTFHEVGNGEPHTATLGTLIDPAVKAYDELTPAQLQAGQPPKALQALDARIPQLFPQGPGDAVQSAANPCYLANGRPPAKTACPKTAAPAFDGTQSFYNSGWLDSNQKWTVHVSDSTAPGTYYFMCLLHRESMTGRLVVAPPGLSVPSPQAQAAAGAKELAVVQAKLKPALLAARQGKAIGVAVPPGVLAGSASQNAQEAEITEFGPKTIHVPVGGSVTWWLVGPHSITFNSDKTNDDIRAEAPDGSVHINAKAVAPANGPGEPPASGGGGANGSSKAPPKFKVVARKTWNGTGFLNSGVFTNSFGPPLIEGYKLTFTHAGTYKYICTVHDDMKGEVVVG
jgi:plastocyanin